MLSSTFRQDLKPRLHDEAINIFLSKIFSKDNFADEMSKLEMCNKNYLSSWAQVGLLKWSIFGGNDRARFAYSWPIQNTFKMVWKNKILKSTMFENDLKCLIFYFWHFSPIFVLLKMTYLVTMAASIMFSKKSPN